MTEIIHNAIRASYPIWLWCDKCNERIDIVGVRTCIENGDYVTVIGINHKCKEKKRASTLTEDDEGYKIDEREAKFLEWVING